MKRVLITGMSGVGKSAVAERLSELGFKAVDLDYGGYTRVDAHGNQHWDVDRVRELLDMEDVDVLFVVGADDAQVSFYADFDGIVLLRGAARCDARASQDANQQPVWQEPRPALEDLV